jgi:hypothetical protein
MKSGKKAEVDVQANWIFILIAAALVIFLVAKVISAQKSAAESAASSKARSAFQTALITAMTNENFYSVSETGQQSFSASCAGFTFDRRLSPVDVGVFFSPSAVSSVQKKAVIRTYPFEFPFKITNAVYVTSPENIYLFINKDGMEKEINEIASLLPDGLDSRVINEADIASEILKSGGRQVRLVFYGRDISPSLVLKQASALSIFPQQSDSGTLKFYSKNNAAAGTSSFYLGKASLLGAIYSDDQNLYECSINRALDKIIVMLALYGRRAEMMKNDYLVMEPHACYSILENTINIMNNFRGSFGAGKISGINQPTLNSITGNLTYLKEMQSQLTRFSCPEAY